MSSAAKIRTWLGCAAAAGLALLATAPVKATQAARGGQRMAEPLFALDYDTRVVKLETLASTPQRTEALGKYRQWINARVDEGGCSYYILSALVRPELDDGKGTLGDYEPDFGSVVRECGKEVSVLGVPDNLFTEQAPVDERLATALTRDAVARYIKAWGGKPGLRRALEQMQRPEILKPAQNKALQEQGLGFTSASAGGSHWRSELQLPPSLKLCTRPPANAFWLVPVEQDCATAGGVVVFSAEAGQGEEGAAAKLLARNGCTGGVRELVDEGQSWTVCEDGAEPLLAVHQQHCANAPVSETLYLLQVPAAVKERTRYAKQLLNVMHHTRLICAS
ncbi:hypothetical protein [Tahibacter harae]|uniref:Uncharacterized protein n=1 Tax=Tahibacter harae TaxID=2963937 RepID=A0ABT1QYB6_9GAMM|nr:hypothetical protein [Tahibacter harae]MCQ4167268.1 hypothetical protein [Tahibacter harae]